MVVAPRRGMLGFHFHDVFLLSDADEATTESRVRSGVGFAVLWSLIGVVLCAWLWTIAEAARVDPLEAYGYPPVALDAQYKASRDMPVSMRRIDILDSAGDSWRHERSVRWMLEGLRSRPWADAQRYLPYRHALGARAQAAQVLREIAGATADPGRAANARAALASWPDGGPEFEW
jgi:hypothetical protein